MKVLSKITSAIFNPLLIPAYGTALFLYSNKLWWLMTSRKMLFLEISLIVLAVTGGITWFWVKKFQGYMSPGSRCVYHNNVYLGAITSLVMMSLFFTMVHFPLFLTSAMAAAALSVFVVKSLGKIQGDCGYGTAMGWLTALVIMSATQINADHNRIFIMLIATVAAAGITGSALISTGKTTLKTFATSYGVALLYSVIILITSNYLETRI